MEGTGKSGETVSGEDCGLRKDLERFFCRLVGCEIVICVMSLDLSMYCALGQR